MAECGKFGEEYKRNVESAVLDKELYYEIGECDGLL